MLTMFTVKIIIIITLLRELWLKFKGLMTFFPVIPAPIKARSSRATVPLFLYS